MINLNESDVVLFARHRLLPSTLLAVFLLGSALGRADAAVTWNVTAGGGWGTASNWDTGVVPSDNSDIIFSSATATGSAKPVTLGATRIVASLTFNAIQTAAVSITTNQINLTPSSNGATTISVDTGSGDHSIASTIQLVAQNNQAFNIGSNRTLTLSGQIFGSTTSRGFTKSGLGTLVLKGSNTYGGDTIISNGTLKFDAANVIPDASSVTVNGTLDLSNFSESINGLNGSGIVENTGAGTRRLTVGAGNASGAFDGTIRDSIAGIKIDVYKAGSGTQILRAASTYSGATQVSAGTLLVNNTIGSATGNSGTIQVSSGATLGGKGIVTSSVNIANNGILSPGEAGPGSVGILTTSHQNWSNGSKLEIDIDQSKPTLADGHDLLSINGDFNLSFSNSTDKLTIYIKRLSTGSLPVGTPIEIISGTGVITNGFNASRFTLIDVGGSTTYQISASGDGSYASPTGSGYSIQISATPEPTTTILFGSAASMLFLGRWRRSKLGESMVRRLNRVVA